MAENRLKIRIGDHEFEAEGPVETVQAQFAAFTELVSSLPIRQEKPQPPAGDSTSGSGENGGGNTGAAPVNLDKVMRASGRVISLTASAASVPDAALLLLLGQRIYRNNDSVTGAEILDGLRESGLPVGRADRILDPLASEGAVITVGAGRGRRYRLSNAGVARAQDIARALIALVP